MDTSLPSALGYKERLSLKEEDVFAYARWVLATRSAAERCGYRATQRDPGARQAEACLICPMCRCLPGLQAVREQPVGGLWWSVWAAVHRCEVAVGHAQLRPVVPACRGAPLPPGGAVPACVPELPVGRSVRDCALGLRGDIRVRVRMPWDMAHTAGMHPLDGRVLRCDAPIPSPPSATTPSCAEGLLDPVRSVQCECAVVSVCTTTRLECRFIKNSGKVVYTHSTFKAGLPGHGQYDRPMVSTLRPIEVRIACCWAALPVPAMG